MDTNRVEFAIVKRGYSPEQVDDYISFLLSRCDELERQCAELDKKYRSAQVMLEESKNEDLLASNIVLEAQKKADSIMRDAKQKALVVSEALADSCDEILSAYLEKARVEREKLQRAERAVSDFKDALFGAYKDHIASIDMILPDNQYENSGLSAATDDDLADSALDLAKQKYEAATAGETNDYAVVNDSTEQLM